MSGAVRSRAALGNCPGLCQSLLGRGEVCSLTPIRSLSFSKPRYPSTFKYSSLVLIFSKASILAFSTILTLWRSTSRPSCCFLRMRRGASMLYACMRSFPTAPVGDGVLLGDTGREASLAYSRRRHLPQHPPRSHHLPHPRLLTRCHLLLKIQNR
jgi:hypothetical protein